MIAHYGLFIGLILLALVTVVAILLGSKAEGSIRRFRDEHH